MRQTHMRTYFGNDSIQRISSISHEDCFHQSKFQSLADRLYIAGLGEGEDATDGMVVATIRPLDSKHLDTGHKQA